MDDLNLNSLLLSVHTEKPFHPIYHGNHQGNYHTFRTLVFLLKYLKLCTSINLLLTFRFASQRLIISEIKFKSFMICT